MRKIRFLLKTKMAFNAAIVLDLFLAVCLFSAIHAVADPPAAVLVNTLNTGIEGITTSTGFHDLGWVGDFQDVNNVINPNYKSRMLISQPIEIGQPQQTGNLNYSETVNGQTLYYSWFTQMWAFQVCYFTEATTDNFLPVHQLSSPYTVTWFDYHLNNHQSTIFDSPPSNWQTGFNDMKSGNTATVGLQGEVSDEQLHSDVGKYESVFNAQIGLAIGANPMNFPDHYNAQNGTFLYNGTAFYINNPIIEGNKGLDTSEFQTGYVTNAYEFNGTQTGFQSGSPIDSINASGDQTPATPNAAPSNQGLKITKNDQNVANAVTLSNANLKPVNVKNQEAGGMCQTSVGTFQTSMYAGDNKKVSGLAIPDPGILPNANTNCYFNLSIDVTPAFYWTTYNWQYTSSNLYVWYHDMQVGTQGCPICLPVYDYRNSLMYVNRAPVVPPIDFIYTKSVSNVYYIQTVDVPISFASIYSWKPLNNTYGGSLPPPTSDTIVPTYSPTTYGTTATTITTYTTGSPPNPFDAILQYLLYGIIAIIGIGLVLVSLLLTRSHRSMNDTNKILLQAKKLGMLQGTQSVPWSGFSAPANSSKSAQKTTAKVESPPAEQVSSPQPTPISTESSPQPASQQSNPSQGNLNFAITTNQPTNYLAIIVYVGIFALIVILATLFLK
jgi:hypothetical protein